MPNPPKRTRLTSFEYTDMLLVKEMACKKCSLPDVYFSLRSCNKGTHEAVETGRRVPKPILSKKFKLNPLRRLVGFEIEVNDYIDGKAISEYARTIGAGMVQDVAFEMNTPPMQGDAMVEKIQEISSVIRGHGAVSYQGSGLHTHVDCRDASWNDIRKLCVLYGKTEVALYSIIDPRRSGRNSSRGGFCKMVGGLDFAKMMSDPSTAKEDIISFVYGSVENLKKVRNSNKQPPGGDRYLGLNLHSWLMRGTVEFRLHQGTTKADKMLNWGMLMGGMVQTAIGKGDREINDWPTGKEGILAYAPTDGVRKWVNERWDYFAQKRKDKTQPLFIETMVMPTKTKKKIELDPDYEGDEEPYPEDD